ncbi:hypothetical protein LZC94_40400 [Pendulispora albinea]|uniref:Uncharacterized protein n=1 Tax=Pendulispora albinea TaxID=2741071 RepID=A0ABZ2LT24_9BACT
MAGARFCSSCGTSQSKRGSLKSSLPTELEQQAIDPATVTGDRAALGVGARVLVQWPDGNRYEGAIEQVAPGQCLVLFPNGQHYWIDVRYVSPA